MRRTRSRRQWGRRGLAAGWIGWSVDEEGGGGCEGETH